ncbi:MAG TPA: hypothetical protein VGM33_11630 [Baekduia sp.]|jgi:hypothetical protein
MATAVQSLIDQVVKEYSFDIDVTQALRELDIRHKSMVARALADRRTITIGETVAGQQVYPVTALELYELYVDGVPYGKVPRTSVAAARQGRLTWSPSWQGLFVATADAGGVAEVGLIPVPDTTGLEITAFAAVRADSLEQAGVIAVDDEFSNALVEGAAATFFARDAEQIPTADRNEARFDAACEELRLRIRARFRKPGPAQIRVQGVNA